MFNIKNLWQKKNEHPLGSPQQAEKLLGELAIEDPYKALGEIIFWLGSVKEAEGFKLGERIAILKLIDDTGQSCKRKLSSDYLAAAVRAQKTQEHRLWAVLNEYCKKRHEVYLYCLDEIKASPTTDASLRNNLPLIMARAMRALAEQKKWAYMRYRLIEDRVWHDIAALTFMAESEGASRSLLSLYPDEKTSTSVVTELIKLLMLDVSSPNSLTPRRLDISERLIAEFSGAFEISETRTANSTFYIDLSAPKAPSRIPENLEPNSTTFFFSAAGALPKLQTMLTTLHERGKQAGMEFVADISALELQDVVRHLIAHWSPSAPKRQHERSPELSRFHVLHTFAQIHKRVADYAKKVEPVLIENKDILYMERVDLKLYGFVTEKTKKLIAEAAEKYAQSEAEDEDTETWTMENKSASGFGATIPQLNEDWVKVGSLIALKRQDESGWHVGVIRRMIRDAEFKVLVGIQALSPDTAIAVNLSSIADAVHITGLLLPAHEEGDALLLAKGSFVQNKGFHLYAGESKRSIRLVRVIERGEDFELVAFSEA